MMMRRLEGKVAIVTGATKEMGETVAERLASEGAAVVCCGRDAARAAACAERIAAGGGRAGFLKVDVSHEDDVRAVITLAQESFGGLDIVVNLAAAVDVIRGGGAKRVTEETDEGMRWQFEVNVMGPVRFFRHGIPAMEKRGGGVFVNLSSLAGSKATPGLAAYSTSKAALEGLSRQVATDYAAANIRSNCIAVGAIRTSQNIRLHDHPVVGPAMRTTQIIQRAGNSRDIAAMVAFLASDDSGFISGEVLPVEGGARVKQVTPDVSAAYAGMAGGRTD